MGVLVFCPSRGRPEAAREAAASLVRTRRRGDTEMMVVIDDDDPEAGRYLAATPLYRSMVLKGGGGMVAALNQAVHLVLAQALPPDIVGFVGDDHRFRTDGWDVEIVKALTAKPGFAYAHDGFWGGGEIPTQIFINREVVEGLGYFALPDCRHLYVDNAWKELALATGSLSYLPQIMVEHMHPAAGKAEWDEAYKRVNSTEMYGRDGAAFSAWRESPRFAEDVSRVRAALPRPQPAR